MESQTTSSDHDLLIEIRTTLGFLMNSFKSMEDKFKTKADQADLFDVERRLGDVERKFWIGTGVLLVAQAALTAVVRMLWR